MRLLTSAWSKGCNLLLNAGPLPDGSVHADDVNTLREAGRRLRVCELGCS
jgi:alpha-L-fucosidase